MQRAPESIGLGGGEEPGPNAAVGARTRGTLLDPQHDSGFGPVLFETVVLAFRRREDVDDDRAEVDEHPVRSSGPLAADRPDLVVRSPR